MAIIALFLSLFVSMAPVAVEFSTFEAIDHIELAQNTSSPISIEVEKKRKELKLAQKAIRLVRTRAGQWLTSGGGQEILWPGGGHGLPCISTGHVVGAIVAVIATIASFISPESMGIETGVVMDSMTTMGTGVFACLQIGEGEEKQNFTLISPDDKFESVIPADAKVVNREVKPLKQNMFEWIAKNRLGKDWWTATVKGCDYQTCKLLFPKAIVLVEGKATFTLVFNMEKGVFCRMLATVISAKMGRKYLPGLFKRISNASYAVVDSLTIKDHQKGGDGDGVIEFSHPDELLVLGVKYKKSMKEIRLKIWSAEHGLIKFLGVLSYNPKGEGLVVHTNMEHNCKGVLAGVAKFVTGSKTACLVKTWCYNTPKYGKASNMNPMTIGQLGTKAFEKVYVAAMLSISEDMHRFLNWLEWGEADMSEENYSKEEVTNEKLGNKLVARREVEAYLNANELPVATFGSVLRYMKSLVNNWKSKLADFESACEERQIRLRGPQTNYAVQISESTFKLHLEITGKIDKNGGYVSLKDRGLKVLWSEDLCCKVVEDSHYAYLVAMGNDSSGDFDGDGRVDCAIQINGEDKILGYRNPHGIYDHDIAEPHEIDIPFHNTSARDIDGTEVELEKLSFEGLTETLTIGEIEEVADELLPTGELTEENLDLFMQGLATNAESAYPVGQGALTQTVLATHHKEATTVPNESLVDGDIQGTASLGTNEKVRAMMDKAINTFKEGDPVDLAMFYWAKMSLNGFTIDKDNKKEDEILLVPVAGAFYKLVVGMVNRRNECAKILQREYAALCRGEQRNSVPLKKLCEKAGLVPDLERGKTAVDFVNSGGREATLRHLDKIDAAEAASIVYSMYCYIDSVPGMFDTALFHAPEQHPGTKYQTICVYLLAWLADNAEGPNPEGDGPSTETTETQTETAETAEMDEHTQFEVLDAMNMKQLIQHCKDNEVKGWSKYRTLAKKGDLIRLIIDNTDDDDDNNPTPPDGGGDNPSRKENTMSEEEYWTEHRLSSNDSVYEDDTEQANRGYELLAAEEDAIKNRVEKLSDKQIILLLKQLMKHEKCWVDSRSLELLVIETRPGWIKAIAELASGGWKLENIEKYIDDDGDNDDDDPTPPNGGGDGPDHDNDDWMLIEQAAEDFTHCGTSEEPETEGEAACRILEAMMPSILQEKAEHEAQKEKAKEEVIPGLTIQENFLSSEEENELVNKVDGSEWDKSMRRWVQHHGYRYDYRNRSVTADSYMGELPEWLSNTTKKIKDLAGFDADQCIVNQYVGAQGIGAHVDCEPCFGDSIVSVSLLEDVIIIFKNKKTGETRHVLVPRKSCLIMSGESRYEWTHEIQALPLKPCGGLRERRISLTFRKVILSSGVKPEMGYVNSSNPLIAVGCTSEQKNGHRAKDIQMAEKATQFVGREVKAYGSGLTGSSTKLYREAWEKIGKANTGQYSENDIVMVSGSGPWGPLRDANGRKAIKDFFEKFYIPLLNKVADAGATVLVGTAAGIDEKVKEYMEFKNYKAVSGGAYLVMKKGSAMDKSPSVGIWTDGACKGNPGRGGWGVVLNSPNNPYYYDFQKTISGGEANATNNRMELMAAIEGLKALKRPSKVSLYSDSTYVVKGITQWVNNWIAKGWKKSDGKPVSNVDLWKELVELNKVHDVEWVWVKGHAGIHLNEMADQLASHGCDDFTRKETYHTREQGSTLLDVVFVVAALLFMSSVAAAFGMEGVAAMCNVVVWREAVDGVHPWKRWNDKKRSKMPVLNKQMNGAKKCMHEVREMTLLSEEEKEEMECHYKTQMAFIQEEIDQLLSEEPTDRPLDIDYNKVSVCSQRCGSKHVKTTRGKNKGKGYWVTHPNCRPDEPCKRACGGSYMQEDELIIRKGERVTLWYTPVKLSQVETYWGNKVVRRDV